MADRTLSGVNLLDNELKWHVFMIWELCSTGSPKKSCPVCAAVVEEL